MSSSRKNTQLLVSGLVAAATLGLIVYFATRPAAATTTRKKKLDDDGGGRPSTGRSVNFAETGSDATPRKSNESSSRSGGGSGSVNSSPSEEKELHTKIEELDKKGKAFFKNKQVRSSFTRRMERMDACTYPSKLVFIRRDPVVDN
jgi:hypothetical protein